LVILFLGTNDLQAVYGVSAYDSAQGVSALIRIIQSLKVEPTYLAPEVLLVIPPKILAPKAAMALKFEGAEAKSAEISSLYTQVTKDLRCHVFDASVQIPTSQVDGVHLDEAEHLKLGTLLAVASTEIVKTA
jgi:lysophospholipase L1-like esterase